VELIQALQFTRMDTDTLEQVLEFRERKNHESNF